MNDISLNFVETLQYLKDIICRRRRCNWEGNREAQEG